MWHLIGVPLRSGKIHWHCFDGGRWDSEEGIKIQFRFISGDVPQRRSIVKKVEDQILQNEVPWVVIGQKGWSIYAESLKTAFPPLASLLWLRGKATVECHVESEATSVFTHNRYEGVVACYITPATVRFSFEDIYNALWVLECEETYIQGTGFMLSGVGLVTCQHVLRPKTHVYKATNYLKKYTLEVVSQNETIDLAIVHVTAAENEALEARTAPELEQWEDVAVAGFPNYRLGDSGSIVPGRVVGFRPVSTIRRALLSCPIVFGMSGGPVLDGDNKVVGVAVTGSPTMEESTKTENHGVVPITALQYLL